MHGVIRNKKILLCDIDGVLLRGRLVDNKRWDTSLKEDLGLDISEVQENFFGVYWSDIIRGHRDLRECLKESLPKINPSVDIETFIKYWFEKDSSIDNNFLNFLNKHKEKGLTLHIATDQEHCRKEYMCKTLGFEKIFDGIFYSANIGFTKEEDGFWQYLKSILSDHLVDNMFFVDDREKNVRKAKEHGIDGYVYTDFEQAVKDGLCYL